MDSGGRWLDAYAPDAMQRAVLQDLIEGVVREVSNALDDDRYEATNEVIHRHIDVFLAKRKVTFSEHDRPVPGPSAE
jgi:hypothetical protein